MHPAVERLSNRSDDCQVAVIDLRDSKAFKQRHICGSLHIDGLDGLCHRFSWLPPPKTGTRPGKELIVICMKEDEAELVPQLSRWNVIAFIHKDDEQFWSDVAKADDRKMVIKEAGSLGDTPPLFFDPSPILDMALEAVENSHPLGPKKQLTVLDLGMGAGRDLAWTVKEDRSFQWLGTGIDNLLSVVERAELLRRDYRLDQKNNSHIEKLLWAEASEDGSLQAMKHVNGSKSRGIPDGISSSLEEFAASNLPHRHYNLILFIRFYPRELLKKITALTRDKSVIAISHFTTVSEEADYASPNRSKRFEEDHITNLLAYWGPNWTVMHHTLHRSEDNRPLRSVVFQRNDCRTFAKHT